MKTLYFAYGSNMDEEQMAQRCPGAEVVGTAVVSDHRFIIYHRGYATLLAEEGAETPGLLWEINAQHEAALDRYEAFPLGLYDKCMRTVTGPKGQKREALVYIAHDNARLGAPQSGYLERILSAAQRHNLPEKHIALLRAWPKREVFTAFNQLVNWMKAENPQRIGIPDPFTGANASRRWNTPVDRGCRLQTAEWLKPLRDMLVLQVLDELQSDIEFWRMEDGYIDSPADADLLNAPERWVKERLLQAALEAADLRAHEHDSKAIGEVALEHFHLARFLRYLQTLPEELDVAALRDNPASQGEVAGLGVIITADPKRIHGPEHRFIVTRHAPLLSALWRHLFHSCEHKVHPRTCDYMGAFAHIAEATQECEEDAVVTQTLAGVADATRERVTELSREIDAWSQDL